MTRTPLALWALILALLLPALTAADCGQYLKPNSIYMFDKLAWEQYLNNYMQARIQQLPKYLHTIAAKDLESFTIVYRNWEERKPDASRIILHESLRDTPIPYILLAHEWEHHLISLVNTKGQANNSGALRNNLNPASMYKEEAQAMGAEWHLVRHISDADANQLVNIINELNYSDGFKYFLRNVLKNRRLDQLAYVDSQRSSGRYSAADTIRKSAKAWGWIAAGGTYLSGVCGGFYLIIDGIINAF